MKFGRYYQAFVILAVGLPLLTMAATSKRDDRNDGNDRGSRRNSERQQSPAKTQQPQVKDLASFKIIQERNIFNPNRYARTGNGDRRPQTRTAQADNVTLTGVMEYQRGTFAFFDGSSSAYRKVVKAGDKFADFKVADIGPESVRLVAGTNEFNLTVGTQMRKEEGAGWQVSGRVELPTGSPSAIVSAPRPMPATNAAPAAPQFAVPPGFEMPMMAPGGPGGPFIGGGPPPEAFTDQQNGAAPPTNTPAAATPSTGNANTDEILRRLAQRREQEMNQ